MQEECQQFFTASSIVSQRIRHDQLSTQIISDLTQLIDNDVNSTETTIMSQSEIVTVSGSQEAASQMTEDSIMKVEKTSLIDLLDMKTHRVCNIIRCNKLRQKLIDQQLKQEIENLKRQVKERARKQEHRAQLNRPDMSQHTLKYLSESSDDDDASDSNSFLNSTASWHHEWMKSDNVMLFSNWLIKRQKYWKLKKLSEYWESSWAELQIYVEQMKTHFNMKIWKWKNLVKCLMWVYQFLREASHNAWQTQCREIENSQWENLKICIETLLAEGRDICEVANEKWMTATQRIEQSLLVFLQYFQVLLSDLNSHYCQSEAFKMKFCTDLNNVNRKLADSLFLKNHKFLTVDELTEWLQQQKIFWETKQKSHSLCDNIWESHNIFFSQFNQVLSKNWQKSDKNKTSTTSESSKILDRQNLMICRAAECHIMSLSDMNSERVRHLEMSNKSVLKCEFITEEEKKAQKQTEQCVKCSQQSHYTADCWTGWHSTAQQSAVTTKTSTLVQTQQMKQISNSDTQETHIKINSLQLTHTSNRESLEAVLILHLEIDAQDENQNWHSTTSMTDNRCKFNAVRQLVIKKLRLKASDHESTVINFDSHYMKIYRTVNISVKIKNSLRQMLHTRETFLSVQKASEDFVLELPFLTKHDPEQNYRKQQIRWKSMLNYEIKLSASSVKISQLKKHHEQKILITDTLIVMTDINEWNFLSVEQMSNSTQSEISVQYSDLQNVFEQAEKTQLSNHRFYDHIIDLEEGKALSFNVLYSMSSTELKILCEYINKNLETELIRHFSSAAASSMMFVSKKDETLRSVINYRELNKITVKNQYSLPLITEALDRLSEIKIFSKLNIKDAYHCIRIWKDDEWKTAFQSWFDLFEYLILFFSLTNASAFFQFYINRALSEYLNVFCIVYLNDVLIYSETETEYVKHMQKILTQLLKFKLYVKSSKCMFHVTEIDFLSFWINTEDIFMKLTHVKSIVNWPLLKSVKDVQQFLDYTNFYRQFIEAYSKRANPLNDYIKTVSLKKMRNEKGIEQINTVLELKEEAKNAFENLKKAFIQALLLKHFNKFKSVWVETDVFRFTITVILTQQHQCEDQNHWHSVTYWSRKLESAEMNYSTEEQEMLAIMCAFTEWRHYLKGVRHQVLILTDHSNLQFFMTMMMLNQWQAHWAEKLSAYNFWVKYWAGWKNSADRLLRRSDYQNSEQRVKSQFELNSILNRVFSESTIKVIDDQVLLKTAALICLQMKKGANKSSDSSEKIQNLKLCALLSEESWCENRQNNSSLQNMKKTLNED